MRSASSFNGQRIRASTFRSIGPRHCFCRYGDAVFNLDSHVVAIAQKNFFHILDCVGWVPHVSPPKRRQLRLGAITAARKDQICRQCHSPKATEERPQTCRPAHWGIIRRAHGASADWKTAIVIGWPMLTLKASTRGPALYRSPIASARSAKVRSWRDSMKANRQAPWRRKSAAPAASVKRVVVPARKDQTRLLVADTRADRMRARRILQHFGERHARERRRQRRHKTA